MKKEKGKRKKRKGKTMIKIAIFNQKGGTAKTTSTFNISGVLAKYYKKKVLVVDGDPQANSSKAFLLEMLEEWKEENKGEDFFEKNPTIVEALKGEVDVNEAIYKAHIKIREKYRGQWRGIDILPTKRSMSAIEMKTDYDIKNIIDKIHRTRKKPYNYDFILFDCPPYLSDFTINILAACDYVLVPATVDMDSLDGYGELVETINRLKVNGINTNLNILGIFLTMINPVESFDKYVYSECQEFIKDKFIELPIRRDTTAKQASSIGVPLCWYKRTSRAAKDYSLLTNEILKRLGLLTDEEATINDKDIQNLLETYKLV